MHCKEQPASSSFKQPAAATLSPAGRPACGIELDDRLIRLSCINLGQHVMASLVPWL